MKVIAKPVEMISYTDDKGSIRPLRFKIQMEDQSYKVIKVSRIILKGTEKIAGNNVMVFRCQSIIGNEEKLFELKYDLNTCRWILFKI